MQVAEPPENAGVEWCALQHPIGSHCHSEPHEPRWGFRGRTKRGCLRGRPVEAARARGNRHSCLRSHTHKRSAQQEVLSNPKADLGAFAFSGARRICRTEAQIREYFASGGSTVPAGSSGYRPSPVDVPTLAPGGLLRWEPQGDFPQLQAVRRPARVSSKISTLVCTFFRPSCVQKTRLTNESEVSSPSNRRIIAYVRVVVLGVLRRAVFVCRLRATVCPGI